MNNQPIGIFDSGIGGLTVTKAIRTLLPSENIIYLGDTARVPYGNKGAETVIKYAKELVHFLLQKQVKVLVIACNTISAYALDEIKRISPVPVIGVVGPAAKVAVAKTKNKRIGLIGTIGTIESGVYLSEIGKLD